MSDSEKESIEKEETIEKSNVSTDKHCESSSSFRKYRWSILAVTILAVAIGIHLITVTRDAFTNGNSDFASDFYQQSIQRESDNIVISPLSVASALGLLSQAANGGTFEQIANGLHLTANKSAIADHFHEYFGKLQRGPLAIFNQIFVQDTFDINDDFQNVAKEKFSSGIESVKFQNPVETAHHINEFVENKTKNEIKNLIDPLDLDRGTQAVLVNVVAFKGVWLNEFERTHEGKFYINKLEKVLVDYMSQEGRFNYAVLKDLNAAALRMDYRYSNFSFVIVLPNAIDGLPALEANLAQYNLNEIVEKMQLQTVEITVPKFKIGFDINLNDILKNMGMTDMFSLNANFSGMLKYQNNDVPLLISKVIHKSVIDFNEDGTEAYSATATGMDITGQIFDGNVEFRADHPFFFYIWDNGTKNVIFSGRVTKFE